MGVDELLGLLPILLPSVDDQTMGQWWLCLEVGFWALVILLTLALLRLRPASLIAVEDRMRAFGRQQGFWLVGFALSVILVRVALLPKMPIPVPTIHDEFSYLLASDTFSHGRLTNPSTPMWQHFESFHINMRPSYQSMYPPAQGMAMALGQKLTGVPWVGVLLSTALMCSAMYWMLLGWLPPSWAWLGGAFSVIRFGIFSYWMNTYMGGSMAALGGALILGALPRLKRETKISTALAFSAGLLIMANSRPLEGFLFSVPVFIAVVWRYAKSAPEGWLQSKRKLVPGLALLLVGLCWIPYYNWRGTGNPLVMPYIVNFKEYHITKPYIFQKPMPIPEYRHQAMRTVYVFHEYPDVARPRIQGISYIFIRSSCRYYEFYLWPFLLLVAAAIPSLVRGSDTRVLLASVGLLFLNLLIQRWPPEAHYAAPATGAIILLIMYSLRHFRNSHGNLGIWASRAAFMVMGLLFVPPIANDVRDPLFLSPIITNHQERRLLTAATFPLQIQRERVKADLDRLPGKQLVIVHHPYHDIAHMDWIYNEADLEHAHILWARDMGYLKNRELIDYYSDRQVWYVDRADPVARLVPYDRAITPWRIALDKFDNDSSSRPQNALTGPPALGKAQNARLIGVSNSGVTSRTASQYVKAAPNAQIQ